MRIGFYVNTKRATLERAATWLLAAATLVVLAAMLHAVLCSFSWYRNRLSDYGIYTNMMWNSAHGHPFRFLMDGSYLGVHLSFTLGLAGLLFRVWDHPFLLSLLQWICLAGGTLVLAITARRQRLPGLMAAALAFFYAGYRLNQSVQLHDFHGVALYLLLIPVLHAGLSGRREWTWLPLALLLGIREDAGIVVLPMLLYYAITQRRAAPAIMSAAALAYSLLAIFVLFPALNGISLFEKRAVEVTSDTITSLTQTESLAPRGRGALLCFLPVAALAHRRLAAAFLFPAAAILQCLASNWPSQYGLGTHYSAPVIALLACGMIESLARRQADTLQGHRPVYPWARAAALLTAVTVAVHVESGFLPGGGKSHPEFHTFNPTAVATLRAAAHVPRDGVLMTDNGLVSFCANRADLKLWHVRHHDLSFDHAFARVRDLHRHGNGALLRELEDGSLGVRYYDGVHLVASRAFDPSLNEEVLRRDERERRVADAPHHEGDTVTEEGLRVRYWDGDGSRSPANLAHGDRWNLNAGDYEIALTYRAAAPRRTVRGHWGWLSVHPLGRPDELARIDLPETPAAGHAWQRCSVRFTLTAPAEVEYRVTSGDAELWLHRVCCSPRAAGSVVTATRN